MTTITIPPAPFILSSSFGNDAYARSVVMTHLRRMAEGKDPYQHLSDMPLINRALWLAAADMIKIIDDIAEDAA